MFVYDLSGCGFEFPCCHIMCTIKEELNLDKSDNESDGESDKCQNICDGLH